MEKRCANVAKAALVALVLAAVTISSSSADEVTDSIDEALEQYKAGKYTEAASSLDYAAQMIRQKKGKNLESFLPKALPGWKAEEASSEAIGAALFGGGVSAQRQYQKGPSLVTVKIVTDSPLLQSVFMVINNPLFAASGGGKLTKIKGQRAIVNYNAEDKTGDVNIVVVNRILVTVEGEEVSRQDLVDYAASLDYKKLANLL